MRTLAGGATNDGYRLRAVRCAHRIRVGVVMSLTPTFTTHPRALQRIRDAKPAVAQIPNFLCKRCGKKVYQFAGRKKAIGGGWKCAE